MRKIRQTSATTFTAEVLDREGKVIVSVVRNSEAECLDFFSLLSASLTEGYKHPIIRE